MTFFLSRNQRERSARLRPNYPSANGELSRIGIVRSEVARSRLPGLSPGHPHPLTLCN